MLATPKSPRVSTLFAEHTRPPLMFKAVNLRREDVVANLIAIVELSHLLKILPQEKRGYRNAQINERCSTHPK